MQKRESVADLQRLLNYIKSPLMWPIHVRDVDTNDAAWCLAFEARYAYSTVTLLDVIRPGHLGYKAKYCPFKDLFPCLLRVIR